MINPYEYVSRENGLKSALKEENPLYFSYDVDFPSALNAKYLVTRGVMGEYIFPRGYDRAPLAILVHGIGDRSVKPCRMIAQTLARRGIASFILYLVFHTYRSTPLIKARYPSFSDDEWFECYRISVTDIRQVIDWAAGRPEIKPDQIGVMGISFGGLVSSIAMGLDTRIKAGTLIVAGGNSEKMTRHSLLLRWKYKIKKTEYLHNQQIFSEYLQQVADKGFENVSPARNGYLTDPLTFSSSLRGRPLLLQNAFWDEMIPRVCTLDFWKACGKPPIDWYPATHTTIWLWYPLIAPRIADFFRSSFSQKQEKS